MVQNTPRYKRILLKLSGEAFQNPDNGEALDSTVLRRNAEQIKRVADQGIQIAIVCGGGNIFRGSFGVQSGIGRTTGDHMGMLATVINSLALQSTLEGMGIATRVMTAFDITAVAEPFIRRKAIRHLEKGRVVIFGAGTGNPYFTTDSAAALRANEIDCDALLKATKVDGIYTADPVTDPTATRFDRISYREAIHRQLRIMDTAAFSLCMENSIPIVVFNFFKPDEILKVLAGEPVGTEVVHDEEIAER